MPESLSVSHMVYEGMQGGIQNHLSIASYLESLHFALISGKHR
jgi:hypothetical protein